MAFSDRLKEEMNKQGVNAAELSRRTGLSEAIISEYRSGKKEPRGKQSVLISKALNISLDDLWETGFQKKSSGLRNKINEIRKANGMSIDDLAQASGVSLSTLKKICAGQTENPTLDTMKAIASALNCTLEDLDEKEKAPAARQELSQEDITMEQSTRLLIGMGFINEGDQLSDRDLAFLSGILNVLDAYFDGRK